MKLFRDNQYKVWAYEPDGSQDHLIPADFIALSEVEAEALRAQTVQGYKVVQGVWTPPTANEVNAKQDARRNLAYQQEADALFFKAARGEIPQQVWLDKVNEIRLRYPKNGG